MLYPLPPLIIPHWRQTVLLRFSRVHIAEEPESVQEDKNLESEETKVKKNQSEPDSKEKAGSVETESEGTKESSETADEEQTAEAKDPEK